MRLLTVKIKNQVNHILRLTEKWTKTDMTYIVKGGFWLNLSYGLTSVLAFLMSIAYANLLPKEIFGDFRYVLSLSGIIGSFSLSGMNNSVTQAVARGYEGTLQKSFLVQLKWGLVVSLFSACSSLFYFINGNNKLAISLLVITIFFPSTNSANTYSAFLNGKKDYRSMFFYTFISGLFLYVPLFITLLFFKKLIILVFVYFVTNFLANTYFYYRTIKIFSPDVNKTDNEAISYGQHLSVMNVIGMIPSQIDSVLIYHYLGPVNLAIYGFSTSIPSRINGLFKFVGTLALPKFAEKFEKTKNARRAITDKVFKMIIISSVFFVIYYLLAPFIYKLFFPQYLESVRYSQVFALSILASASNLTMPALITKKAKKELYIFSTVGPIMQTIVMFLCIYNWGIWGAIIAKLFSQFFNLSLSIFFLGSKTRNTSTID